MIITVRLAAGAYVARAKGHKVTASSTESARRAVERLAEKLGHNPDLVQLEDSSQLVQAFSLPEACDG
ncbi:hypothetical protein D3C81_1685230 [compost metagenome]